MVRASLDVQLRTLHPLYGNILSSKRKYNAAKYNKDRREGGPKAQNYTINIKDTLRKCLEAFPSLFRPS